MAVSAPPGRPNASKGIIAAPVAALFAVSEEITPSSFPVPNSDLFFDHLTASPYPIKAAKVAPIPGKIPQKKPTKIDLTTAILCAHNSKNDGKSTLNFGAEYFPLTFFSA